jgi:hypothetical protein
MSKGYLLIAQNNSANDYVKQAVFCAERIKKFCSDASVSIITNSVSYLEKSFDSSLFDHIIDSKSLPSQTNTRLIFDGALSNKSVNWKNVGRDLAYSLTPYEETILLDTDYIFCNDILDKCFGSKNDILMYKKSKYLGSSNIEEFTKCADTSIDFYWATIIYFKKTEKAKIFFDLVTHIRENWFYYNNLYQINSPNFRNDYAFSIAIHTMNSMTSGNFIGQLPGKMYYTKDQDFLENITDEKLIFLVGKKDYLGEYTLVSSKGLNVHVLNKASLEREIG